MAKVAITIDGKKIWAEEGSNLLETALQNNIEIPHLCYDPRIKPFGSCRMCFVDTGNPRGPVAACGTTVTEGMKVETSTEELHSLRRTALELLMSEHCGDCIAPCQQACPAHIDIQGYIAYLDRREYKRAAELIKERMPLPSICGRVCPRFCEDECRRSMVDEPVNICDLKRFAGDFDLDAIHSYNFLVDGDTGKTAAVVGGGPAGLTAAYYLALKGHRVTLYDRGPELGGMLRYGIPEYRLPKALLDREVELIAGLCKEVRLGEIMGKDFSLEELQEKYDAVFLGPGCQSAQGMGLEKENMPGVLRGIDFLRSVAEGSPPSLGRRVAVVGGGNTAMDTARTALRLGAAEVSIIYRRTRNEMPASSIEIVEAEEEGIKFYYLTNPSTILGGDCVQGLECIRMELGEPDESGRRRPVAIKGSEFEMEADNVIMAIGQTIDKENASDCGLELDGKKLAACKKTYCTSHEGVFAAGDAVTGPATVVEAVGAARKASLAMDLYLRGVEVALEKEEFNCSMGKLSQLDPEDFSGEEKIERVPVHHLPPGERRQDFREYNMGLAADDIHGETKRCLSCGCREAFDCDLRRWATNLDLSTRQLGVETKRYPICTDHPYIEHDPNKCILCASCVRICQEVQGVYALNLVNRGYDTVVKPALDLPLKETNCESCGQCVSVCPTGALTGKGFLAKPGPWRDDRVVRTPCVQCGIGCLLDLHVVADRIVKVTSPLRRGVNDGNLCVKGAFEYDFLHSKERITRPIINIEGKPAEVTWDEAVSSAAAGLKKVKENQGSDSLAVLVSPNLSSEEAYLAQKIAREALDTLNVDTTVPLFGGGIKPGGKDISYDELTGADFILLLDVDLPEDYPVMAHKVREALSRGAKLTCVSQKASRLENVAHLAIPLNPGKTLPALAGFMGLLAKPGPGTPLSAAELKPAVENLSSALRVNPALLVEAADALMKAQRPVIVVDGQQLGAGELALLEAIAGLVEKGDEGVILPLYPGGNSKGLLEVGVDPALLPGGGTLDIKGLSFEQVKDKAASGELKGLLALGDDPRLDGAFGEQVFIVALATTWRKSLEEAGVILPAAAFAETKGTVTNCAGARQELKPACPPPGGKENWQILKDLLETLDQGMDIGSLEDIRAKI